MFKHTSGGDLSALAYSPALGRLIRKSLTKNIQVNSASGYRNVSLNLDGRTIPSEDQILSNAPLSPPLCHFILPTHIIKIKCKHFKEFCYKIRIKIPENQDPTVKTRLCLHQHLL